MNFYIKKNIFIKNTDTKICEHDEKTTSIERILFLFDRKMRWTERERKKFYL